MKSKRVKYFIGFIIVFLIEVFIAVYVHDNFIRPYIGDILIIICIYLFAKTIFLNKLKHLSLYVLILAIVVEVMQYFNLANLIANNNRVMKIILGSTFDIKDIICYVIGYIIIVLTEKMIRRKD